MGPIVTAMSAEASDMSSWLLMCIAASTTDFIQSIVMTIALVVVLIFGINTAGGMDVVIKEFNEVVTKK